MDVYTFEDGKTLRCGYTTGTTAAMASLASAKLLLTGEKLANVSVLTPKGIVAEAEVEVSELFTYTAEITSITETADNPADLEAFNPAEVMSDISGKKLTFNRGRNQDEGKKYAVCAVRKDGGDDKDVTNGLLIYARTELIDKKEVIIEAGEGIGIVTKPGLSVSVGEPAINPVPRRMIEGVLMEALRESGTDKGIKCTIYVPEGKKAAESTFNPNLGIEGGISIIGTSGIVEPMSKKAFADAVCLEIRQQAALGNRKIILTPGNYGLDFIEELYDGRSLTKVKNVNHIPDLTDKPAGQTPKLDLSRSDVVSSGAISYVDIANVPIVVCSNFIGEAIDETISDDFERVFLIGHAGKLVKLAGGIMNTHSRMADCRMELICAHAAVCGADTETCRRIMDCTTTDAAFGFLEGCSKELMTEVIASLYKKIDYHLKERIRKHEKDSDIKIEAFMFVKSDGRYILL